VVARASIFPDECVSGECRQHELPVLQQATAVAERANEVREGNSALTHVTPPYSCSAQSGGLTADWELVLLLFATELPPRRRPSGECRNFHCGPLRNSFPELGDSMRHCVRCGEKLPRDAKFCPACGYAVSRGTVNETRNVTDIRKNGLSTVAMVSSNEGKVRRGGCKCGLLFF